MLALLWFVSRDALAIDLLVGIPLRHDPFAAFTTEIANGLPTSTDTDMRSGFRGELSAAVPFRDLGASSQWIVDVGLRTWEGSFARDGRSLEVSANEPRVDVGIHLGSRRESDAHAYAAMGVGVIVSTVTSSDWRTFAFPSPHAFLAAGVAVGGDTKGIAELRVSPVLRDDTYTRETLLENGGAGFRFSPGGAALTASAGLRFL